MHESWPDNLLACRAEILGFQDDRMAVVGLEVMVVRLLTATVTMRTVARGTVAQQVAFDRGVGRLDRGTIVQIRGHLIDVGFVEIDSLKIVEG